jgi:hypothetical protein
MANVHDEEATRNTVTNDFLSNYFQFLVGQLGTSASNRVMDIGIRGFMEA